MKDRNCQILVFFHIWITFPTSSKLEASKVLQTVEVLMWQSAKFLMFAGVLLTAGNAWAGTYERKNADETNDIQ